MNFRPGFEVNAKMLISTMWKGPVPQMSSGRRKLLIEVWIETLTRIERDFAQKIFPHLFYKQYFLRVFQFKVRNGTQTKKERFQVFILLSLERVSVLFLMPQQFFLTITFLVVVLARIFVVVVFGTVLWYPGHFVLFFQASSGIGEPGGDLNYEFHNSFSKLLLCFKYQ